MISTLFTSILAIWLLILSARVIALRGASFLKFFAFNNFGEKALSRSVRAQGNFIEYTPFFLILLFIAEFNGSHPHFLYLVSGLFLISRLMFKIRSQCFRSGSNVSRSGSNVSSIVNCDNAA